MDKWTWEALQRALIQDWRRFRIDYGHDADRAERAWRVRVANLQHHALSIGDVPVEKYMARLTGQETEREHGESEARGDV